jgi:hypothetical protein
MSYLNSLKERLRKVAQEVFPSDPEKSVRLTHMNKYTRIYLRHIIQRARNSPFNFTVTDQQLARLFHLPLAKFSQWFRHDAKLPKVFRRVRWFLREIIIANILEDRGQLGEPEDSEVKETPIKWPNKKTMVMFKQRAEAIRVEYQNRGPVIEDLAEANEMIGWMQPGYSSSSSFEDDSESIGFGEDPDEARDVREDTYESTDSRGLNGSPDVLTDQQLLDQFKNVLISDKLDDLNNDDEVFLPVVNDRSVKQGCPEFQH